METPTNPRQRILVIGLIILGLMIVGFFGMRTFRAFRQFHGHRPPGPLNEHVETDVELIRDWMTLPYISMTYRLPHDLLYQTLNIPPEKARKQSLKQLNNEYYPQAPGTVLEKVKAAILAYQATQTPVSPSSPTPTGSP